MQQLRDKLNMAEKTAKYEAQLKVISGLPLSSCQLLATFCILVLKLTHLLHFLG